MKTKIDKQFFGSVQLKHKQETNNICRWKESLVNLSSYMYEQKIANSSPQ